MNKKYIFGCFLFELASSAKVFTAKNQWLERVINLDWSGRNIIELDHQIYRYKCLESLNVSDNKIEVLPIDIGLSKSLLHLNISSNFLAVLPQTICNLKNLRSLNASYNTLIKLPKSIKRLSNLHTLLMNNNGLQDVPDSICDLRSLKHVDLSNNNLTSFPENVGNLSTLRLLLLSHNKLNCLPESIGRLDDVRYLCLQYNNLSSIPDTIGNLTKLKWLHLKGNHLETLPDTISNMKGLRRLDISYNKIKYLPLSLLQLYGQLESINISGNNDLLERGDDKSIGRQDLIDVFGEAIIIDNTKGAYNTDAIPVESVYKMLASKKLHWNFEKLRKCQLSAVKTSSYCENKTIQKLQELTESTKLSTTELNNLYGFIHYLYNPEDSYDKWPMPKTYVPLAKNLLCQVMIDLEHKNDVLLTSGHLKEIAESINHCPDRQMGELSFAYKMLHGLTVTEHKTLKDVVKQIVTEEKETLFDQTFTIKSSAQNVHVLNYWKYTLRDECGFNFPYQSVIILPDHDVFRGNPGNALNAFYASFTPEWMIATLTDRINEKGNFLCVAAQWLCKTDNIDEDEKRKMFVSDTDSVYELCAVTPMFSKYVLKKFGFVVENDAIIA